MKKYFFLLIVFMMMASFCFSACGEDPKDDWDKEMENLPPDVNDKLYGDDHELSSYQKGE